MSISTLDVLEALGFQEDSSIISDPPGGRSFDFGNLKLSASFVFSPTSYRDVVLLTGVLSTSRSIAVIDAEMPREVESREQGVAWLTHFLDQHAYSGEFVPAVPVFWLAIGREYRHLLPWVRQMAAYEARPHCLVDRDWARVALRKLAEIVAGAADESQVMLAFDGEVLKMRCMDGLVAVPARGTAWGTRYAVRAGQLRALPKRLMREWIEFSIWESALRIGGYVYGNVWEIGPMPLSANERDSRQDAGLVQSEQSELGLV